MADKYRPDFDPSEYDPSDDDFDAQDFFDDPYDHLEDQMDELLQNDAYKRDLPKNYNNGYGEDSAEPVDGTLDSFDWQVPDQVPRQPPRREPPRQPQINAYNVDYESSGRRTSRRSREEPTRRSREESARRGSHAEQRARKTQRSKRDKRRGRHLFLKFLLVLLILLGLAAAALWFFAKQPVSESSLGERKPNCSTILLAGTDEDGLRTDTMLLLYLNKDEKQINLLSLPRDTYTSASWNVPKLNSVYGTNGCGEEGMEALLDYVMQCIGYRPDGYLLVDMDCFATLVDRMGGVEFDVPMDMEYHDPAQDLNISLKAGPQKLNGEEAMWLVRFRSGYALADLERIQVQRDFMKAAMQQWAKPSKLFRYPGAATLLASNTTTNLSLRNLVWIAKTVLAARGGEMQMQTLPGEAAMISGGSYYVLWPETTAELINESYNPYQVPVSSDAIYSPWY